MCVYAYILFPWENPLIYLSEFYLPYIGVIGILGVPVLLWFYKWIIEIMKLASLK